MITTDDPGCVRIGGMGARLLQIAVCSASLFFMLFYCGQSEAESGGKVVARGVTLDKKVLFFNTSHGERVFTVGWIDRDGQVWEKRHVSRKGFHAYEMRDHPAWKGMADSVSVMGISADSARVDIPDISAEMDIFLAYEPWMRSSVNALWGHTLFGFSWNSVLLSAWLFFTATLFIVKRYSLSFSRALFAGFIFTMVVVDIRAVWDHIRMAESLGENESLAQTKGLASFSRQLGGRIGGESWSYMKLPDIAAINIAYGLAEKKFVPPRLASRPRYVISYVNGGIVLIPPGR